MEFQVKVNGIDYKIKTRQNEKLTYLVETKNEDVEISMSTDNEWVSIHIGGNGDSIPVQEIGKAIEDHF